MTEPLTLLSSMATKRWLTDAAAEWARQPDSPAVAIESVGGVDAARRVRNGAIVDIVLLASNAIDALTADGCLEAGSRVDLVDSEVAVAVRAGAPRPDIATEAGLRAAVLAAQTVGYSTGPSGVALAALFERWGIGSAIHSRIVEAPPGVPVGSLVADGKVELGFQQLSEMLPLAGIDILGPLPAENRITTTFSAGIATTAPRAGEARRFVAFLGAPASTPLKVRHGLSAPAG